MKLSIITINLNNADGLCHTINSVINQTYKNIEYIIIDGGSSDNSCDVIKKFEEHLTYWISENDNGIYEAMNKGIRKSTGDYIYMLNSGDIFYSNNTIKNIFENNSIKNNTCDFIIGGIILTNKDKCLKVKYSKELSFRYFINGGPPCHQATFTKRNLFHKYAMYDEKLIISSDWKLILLALFKHNCSYVVIDEYIAFYQIGGISSNIMIRDKERYLVLHENFANYENDIKLIKTYNKLNLIKRIYRFYNKHFSKVLIEG